MRKPGDAPVLTLVLGFGGLVPFAGSALAIMAGGQAALQFCGTVRRCVKQFSRNGICLCAFC